MIRAVLDTNVLVSATIVPQGYAARIVGLWDKRRFVPLLSPVLLEEVDEVLRYPRICRRHGWSEEKIQRYAVLFRFYVSMRPGHNELANAVCIVSKRRPSAPI